MPSNPLQTLEASLGLTDDTFVNLSFVQKFVRLIDLKILPLESQRQDLNDAIEAVRAVGLDRINEVLTPAIQTVLTIQERGFLIANSDSANTLGVGNVLTFNIPDEDERDVFTPSQFLFLSRLDNTDDWGIARLSSYDRLTGNLVVIVTAYDGDEGPHADWQVSAVAGSTIAQMALLTLAEALYADVVTAKTDAETSATNSAASASASSTSAGTATTQAGIATTQAGISTTQAGISTAQAGIATTKAAEAAASAASVAGGPVTSVNGHTGIVTLGTSSELNVSTDTTLAANSDTLVPSQKAIKAYADGLIEAANALQYKGTLDCSTNPNYPAANAGHFYIVTVAGKIGGASGITVDAGDALLCKTDSTAAGTQAAVGAQWGILQFNLIGALTSADIASTVQAYSAILTALAGVTGASNKLPYFSGATAMSVTDFSAFGRSLVDDADAAAVLATLGLTGLTVGADYQVFNASGTWTKPAGKTTVLVLGWGAGASGASSASGSAGAAGGGGAFHMMFFKASDLGATETVTVGTGGTAVTGGAASGNSGGNSSFGSWLAAYGGAGGTTSGPGGGGGGISGAGSGVNGGAPKSVAFSATLWDIFGGGDGNASGGAGQPAVNGGGGGGKGNGAQNGGNSVFGGAGGGSNTGTGGTSKFGGNGGAGSTAVGTPAGSGVAPGGAGGANTASGQSGAGANGRVIVIAF